MKRCIRAFDNYYDVLVKLGVAVDVIDLEHIYPMDWVQAYWERRLCLT